MSATFWFATVFMTCVAVCFLAGPLLRAGSQKLLMTAGVTVPVFAAAFYLMLGSPQAANLRPAPSIAMAAVSAPSATPGGRKVGSVSSMVDGLAARLEENPDDGKGWLLLAKSYQHMGRSDDAAAAYARAAALGVTDPSFETAANPVAAAVQPAEADPTKTISGRVSLSEQAAALVQPTDTVFIFARPASGSRAPAAVLRRPASQLPIDFRLDDSQSMVEGITLSGFDEVVVTARISRSGVATDSLQGLEARSDLVRVADANPVDLLIE